MTFYSTMKVSDIYRELLSEDVKLAEKLLKSNGFDLNNPEYLTFKNRLVGDNKIGYLGIILRFNFNLNQTINTNFMNRVYDFILNHESTIKNLPKSIYEFNYYSDFRTLVLKQEKVDTIKKIINKLSNKDVKYQLSIIPDDWITEYYQIFKTFNELKPEYQKDFLTKTNKYKTAKEFIENLESFIEEIKIGFTYENVIKKINSLPKDSIKILFAEKNIIFASIYTYEASQAIGSTSWCIVSQEDQFNDYTKNGLYSQFFIFNFNSDVKPNEKMIAFTMDYNNRIYESKDRYDKDFNDIIEYLENFGIKNKVYFLNKREKTKKQIIEYLRDSENNDDNFYEFNPEVRLINLLEYNNYKQNIEIILKNFQFVTIYKLNKMTETVKTTHNAVENLFMQYDYISTLYNEGYLDDVVQFKPKDFFIKFATNVYLSNLSLNEDTIYAIVYFLKKNNVDVDQLHKLRKNKYNEDESSKMNILNKLSELRKGEDVYLTPKEIKFGVDYGYQKLLQYHYKKMIPDFYYEPIDYDMMNILKTLNLLNDAGKYIGRKAKDFGLDSLNSIEKSIYDYYSK